MTQSAVADEIGRKGEAYFDNIMADTDLLVGRIDPDRVGKDRIIETKLALRDEKTSFDQRPAPLACSIQIKTVMPGTKVVTLSLSVAERFAQSLQPCFIYIIRLDEQRKPIEARAIHIIGDTLAKILKRLRKEFVASTTDLHLKNITFQIKSAKKLGLEGEHLKAFLQAEIGPDMDSYCSKKGKQKQELGYEPGRPVTINGSFESENLSDIVDGLLGLKPLPMTNVAAHEKRFGIPVPVPTPNLFQPGSLAYIEPEPMSQCTLIIGNPGGKDTVEIVCDVILPATGGSLPAEHFKARLRAPFIEATVGFDEITVRTLPEWATGKPRLLSEWIGYYRALNAFSNAKCPLFISGVVGVEKLGVATPNDPLDNREATSVLNLLQGYERIREAAGVGDIALELRNLIEAWSDVQRISAFLSGNFPKNFSFHVQHPPPDGMPEKLNLLFLSAFSIGDEHYACGITCAVQTEESGDEILVKQSGQFSFADIVALDDHEEALVHYRQRLRRLCKVELSLTSFPHRNDIDLQLQIENR